MRNERWQSAFDLLGLAAYLTIMSGGLVGRELVDDVRRNVKIVPKERDPRPQPSVAERPAA